MLPKRRPIKESLHHRRNNDFIAAWLRSPLKMGAIMPSSRGLARALATQVNIKADGLVVELGAGTGVVTHALIEAGISPMQLLIIERDPKLHAILQVQFPNVHVVCGDAAQLVDIIAKIGNPVVNSIISSLPLLSMPKEIQRKIQQQMVEISGMGGIVQFTYGAKSPLNRNELRKYKITGKRVKSILKNVPPAHIWVYKPAKKV